MGNRLCKLKTDGDHSSTNNPKDTITPKISIKTKRKRPASSVDDKSKTTSPFERIIDRLHLRPNSWKSESHLNQQNKQATRIKDPDNQKNNKRTQVQQLSKSSDWTEVSLEAVPPTPTRKENPKLSLIFDGAKPESTKPPTPPPRHKHRKNLREKIEAVAKNGLMLLNPPNNNNNKEIEEPLCVKRTVKPTCPREDHDCAIHRNRKVTPQPAKAKELTQDKLKSLEDDIGATKRRRKNLSVISLPNYSDLKLTVANFDNIDQKEVSLVSLPSGTSKLEMCMTRCRSFGSLLPQQLLEKLRVTQPPPVASPRQFPTKQSNNIESDDSFGGLEDWDLGIIEHYNPNDASLPRPRKRTSKNLEQEVESLIEPADADSAKDLPVVEHSSLMKILEEFSIKDKVEKKEMEKRKIEQFLDNEKLYSVNNL